MSSKRINYFDTAKGIAIISVVIGHYIQNHGLGYIPLNLFYSFHMPLFFVVSGFFSTSDLNLRGGGVCSKESKSFAKAVFLYMCNMDISFMYKNSIKRRTF